jgi:hypothetical protein
LGASRTQHACRATTADAKISMGFDTKYRCCAMHISTIRADCGPSLQVRETQDQIPKVDFVFCDWPLNL